MNDCTQKVVVLEARLEKETKKYCGAPIGFTSVLFLSQKGMVIVMKRILSCIMITVIFFVFSACHHKTPMRKDEIDFYFAIAKNVLLNDKNWEESIFYRNFGSKHEILYAHYDYIFIIDTDEISETYFYDDFLYENKADIRTKKVASPYLLEELAAAYLSMISNLKEEIHYILQDENLYTITGESQSSIAKELRLFIDKENCQKISFLSGCEKANLQMRFGFGGPFGITFAKTHTEGRVITEVFNFIDFRSHYSSEAFASFVKASLPDDIDTYVLVD